MKAGKFFEDNLFPLFYKKELKPNSMSFQFQQEGHFLLTGTPDFFDLLERSVIEVKTHYHSKETINDCSIYYKVNKSKTLKPAISIFTAPHLFQILWYFYHLSSNESYNIQSASINVFDFFSTVPDRVEEKRSGLAAYDIYFDEITSKYGIFPMNYRSKGYCILFKKANLTKCPQMNEIFEQLKSLIKLCIDGAYYSPHEYDLKKTEFEKKRTEKRERLKESLNNYLYNKIKEERLNFYETFISHLRFKTCEEALSFIQDKIYPFFVILNKIGIN